MYAHAGRLARRVDDDGRLGPVEVAPVLGGGGLSIEGRYTAWMAVHQGFPWLFDPAEKWRYEAKAGFSKSSNSPWSGQTLTGRVKSTIVEGRVVFANGKISPRN